MKDPDSNEIVLANTTEMAVHKPIQCWSAARKRDVSGGQGSSRQRFGSVSDPMPNAQAQASGGPQNAGCRNAWAVRERPTGCLGRWDSQVGRWEPDELRARNFQLRSGRAVHQCRVHRRAGDQRRPHQHGGQKFVTSTTFSSSGCAPPEVRGHLIKAYASEARRGIGGRAEFLRWRASAPGADLSDPIQSIPGTASEPW
jgi:hypothetical protein